MENVNFTLNHRPVSISTDLNRRLLDVLRKDFGLVGTKEGCGEGECGACSVLINHQVINSCLFVLANANGADILTIEGFSETEQYRVLKEAFIEQGAVQCGFCTPGMIMAAESLLYKNPHPTDEEIKIGLSGNLCRCTGYQMIISAIRQAAEKGNGLW